MNNSTPAILVADDDSDILQILDFSLSKNGFSVQLSRNGEMLWEIIARSRPDVILLDIQMDGIDGGTVCRKLKQDETTAGIPVLMFSANDDIEDIARTCGAEGFIPKPFNLEKVKAKILDTLAA